jgi:hypothetical protein
MTSPKKQNSTRVFLIALTSILAILSIGRTIDWGQTASFAQSVLERLNLPIQSSHPAAGVTFDLNRLGRDAKLAQLTVERKQRFGIDKGLDLISRADEIIRIGTRTVAMKEILDEIDSAAHLAPRPSLPAQGQTVDGYYGIYLVEPDDNIWNIHILFLQEALASRGISLLPIADEPDHHGFSSGQGKILNFPDEMAHIYNIAQRRLERDLSRVTAMNLLIVYDLQALLRLLDQIDQGRLNHIEFDGQSIWMPGGP